MQCKKDVKANSYTCFKTQNHLNAKQDNDCYGGLKKVIKRSRTQEKKIRLEFK